MSDRLRFAVETLTSSLLSQSSKIAASQLQLSREESHRCLDKGSSPSLAFLRSLSILTRRSKRLTKNLQVATGTEEVTEDEMTTTEIEMSETTESTEKTPDATTEEGTTMTEEGKAVTDPGLTLRTLETPATRTENEETTSERTGEVLITEVGIPRKGATATDQEVDDN